MNMHCYLVNSKIILSEIVTIMAFRHVNAGPSSLMDVLDLSPEPCRSLLPET